MHSSSVTLGYVETISEIVGGGPISLLTLVENLNRDRYTAVFMFYAPGKLPERLSFSGEEVHILTRRGMLSQLQIVLRFAGLVRRRNIRLVHVNSLDIRAGIAAKLCGVPLVGHLRVVFPFTWVDRLFVRLSTRVISVSDAVRDIFCEGHRRLRPKFTTIPNAVSLKGLSRKTDIRSEMDLSPTTRLVAAVSRIDPWKGLHTFIQATAGIRSRATNVKFLLLGSADPDDAESIAYERKLRCLVDTLSLSEDFHFLGFRSDALSIIEQIDVLVVSSLVLKTKTGQKTEGFGRVVIEGMALGTPVVATRVGGIPEIIEDGKSGILVPPESPNAMAKAVISLLGDESLRNRIIQGGRQRFLDRYQVDRHIDQIQSLYEQILNRYE